MKRHSNLDLESKYTKHHKEPARLCSSLLHTDDLAESTFVNLTKNDDAAMLDMLIRLDLNTLSY
jgi:hypothetical protein